MSGRLYKPLDTAVPQQFFATSMVLTPLIRGLLGIDVDAPARRVTIAPHLPPDWDSVAVDRVPVGRGSLSFVLRRTAGGITASVSARQLGDAGPLEVVFSPALPLGAKVTGSGLTVETTPGDVHATVKATVTAAAELTVSYTGGWSLVPPVMPATIGQRSSAPRVLSERLGADGRYVVSLEGIAGRSYPFRLRTPGGVNRLETISFPSTGANADGYTAVTVSFGGKQ